MLKTAYQMGVQQAFQDGGLEELVKEAQNLGLDLEKLGFGWGNIGSGLAKTMGWAAKNPFAANATVGLD